MIRHAERVFGYQPPARPEVDLAGAIGRSIAWLLAAAIVGSLLTVIVFRMSDIPSVPLGTQADTHGEFSQPPTRMIRIDGSGTLAQSAGGGRGRRRLRAYR